PVLGPPCPLPTPAMVPLHAGHPVGSTLRQTSHEPTPLPDDQIEPIPPRRGAALGELRSARPLWIIPLHKFLFPTRQHEQTHPPRRPPHHDPPPFPERQRAPPPPRRGVALGELRSARPLWIIPLHKFLFPTRQHEQTNPPFNGRPLSERDPAAARSVWFGHRPARPARTAGNGPELCDLGRWHVC